MSTESKQIPQLKLEEVQALKDLIDKYPVICLAKMNKLGERQLQSQRKWLGELVGTIAPLNMLNTQSNQSKFVRT